MRNILDGCFKVKVEWLEDVRIDDYYVVLYLKWCNLLSYYMLKRWLVVLFYDEKVCFENFLGFIFLFDSYLFLLLNGFFGCGGFW